MKSVRELGQVCSSPWRADFSMDAARDGPGVIDDNEPGAGREQRVPVTADKTPDTTSPHFFFFFIFFSLFFFYLKKKMLWKNK